MIITDRFVFVHMPKTGGTFVSSVLRKIHEARGDQVVRVNLDAHTPGSLARHSVKSRVRGLIGLHNTRRTAPPSETALQPDQVIMLFHRKSNGDLNQHGLVADIPAAHRHKLVLGVVRNPYDRYVSQYEYKWWTKGTDLFARHDDAVKRQYPHFPDLSFQEFVIASNHFLIETPTHRLPFDQQLGRQSIQFLNYFLSDPSVIGRIDEAYLAEARYRAGLVDNLHMLFTDNLNRGLYDFLRDIGGYAESEIAFILDQGKILPRGSTRKDEQRWESYYTPQLKAWVRHRERVLLALYPHWDV